MNILKSAARYHPLERTTYLNLKQKKSVNLLFHLKPEIPLPARLNKYNY